jgi:D-alanyl-D-alanine dipeptidase
VALCVALAGCGAQRCEGSLGDALRPWLPPADTTADRPPADAAAPGAPLPGAADAPVAEPSGPALVDLADVDSTIRVDMRYATPSNFLHEAVYPTNRCLLRPATAERLKRAQAQLAAVGLGLQVWDCYRPLHVQQRMWEIVPDPRYVADPKEGSRHNRGAAVDVTLVRLDGAPLEMGTGHDDFSEKASRTYSDFPYEVVRNRKVLENALGLQGFVPLETEWWHYDDPDWQRYAILDVKLYVPPEERSDPGASSLPRAALPPAEPAPAP